ncbi:MAG: LPS export ABC transporter permease LptG [Hyphomicrobiales bacterium]|nr:LPS export ABC transporter permease LptG [Hyphomicrobiales bacterium]
MIGPTFSRYLAMNFLKGLGVTFGAIFALIYMIDFVEMLRRAGGMPGSSVGLIAWLCLLRTPKISEQVLPFATLFGTLAVFLMLSRRLELVIARAAGISAAQFLAIPLALIGGLGVASVMVYNPLSALAKQHANVIETRLFRTGAPLDNPLGLWVRQRSGVNQSILRAGHASQNGTKLSNVEAYLFNPDGAFFERIDADAADYADGAWHMHNVRVLRPGHETEARTSYDLPTNLMASQINQTFGNPDAVPFWSLPSVIISATRAGLQSAPYRLRYQGLLARPFLLMAMALIAASFSLRFFRFGGMVKTVIGGIVAGFVLYVASQLIGDMGSAGLISVAVAAWAPAALGMSIGTLALLHREDG